MPNFGQQPNLMHNIFIILVKDETTSHYLCTGRSLKFGGVDFMTPMICGTRMVSFSILVGQVMFRLVALKNNSTNDMKHGPLVVGRQQPITPVIVAEHKCCSEFRLLRLSKLGVAWWTFHSSSRQLAYCNPWFWKSTGHQLGVGKYDTLVDTNMQGMRDIQKRLLY